MVFSSVIFIFCFLPIVLALYAVINPKYRNLLLLIASLLFYYWGAKEFTLLLIISSLSNYLFGLSIDKSEGTRRKVLLVIAIILNLGVLGIFKYFNFFMDNMNSVLTQILHILPVQFRPIALPVGISFFTFHELSYVIDIYRKKVVPTKSFKDLTLYIAFFPQLIAGPIVRYIDIHKQLVERIHSSEKFVKGVERFILGLSKKVLIANPVGSVVDQIFSMPPSEFSQGVAILGIVCYTLQIYFDFSGYSDMAIGLAKMFGFDFLENFNYPYIATSIKDFWRRWHISLSTWFKDYLYIPLGGNKISPKRTYINLLIVFFLTGLWHGAAWNFVFWGLLHGFFLILERGKFGVLLDKLPNVVKHVYTLSVVMLAWVFFRAENFAYAMRYIKTTLGFGSHAARVVPMNAFVDNYLLVVILAGMICSTPILPYIKEKLLSFNKFLTPIKLNAYAGLLSLFLLDILTLSTSTYNPFIYFRF